MKNSKIGPRLLLTFLIIVLVTSISGMIGVIFLDKADAHYSAALQDYGFAQGDIGKLGQTFQAHRATVLYIIYADMQKMRKNAVNKWLRWSSRLLKSARGSLLYKKMRLRKTTPGVCGYCLSSLPIIKSCVTK